MARRPQERPIFTLKIDPLDMKRAATDTIVELVREAILSHELPGGTPLIEQQLAEMFGVSKTPVREALLRLTQSGLIDLAHGRGATVHSLSLKEMQDLLEMRQVLEPLALSQSAPLLTPDDIAALKTTLYEAEQARHDFSALSALNSRFHTILYSRASNALLLNWLASLQDRRRLIAIKGWLREDQSAQDQQEHHAILAAIKTERYATAVSYLKAHIERSAHIVLCHHPLAQEES